MGINIRDKGANGERELAGELNVCINGLLVKRGLPLPEKPVVQRNQNQSAVGGGDFSTFYNLCIEVKRQEQLSVNTWWAQCEASAKRNHNMPILIYRQNKQKWSVVMYVQVPTSNTQIIWVRATIDWPSFMSWFRQYVDNKLENGELPKV